MKVEVVTAYGPFSVGQIIPDMPGGEARTRIARGMVKEVKAMQSAKNRAIQTTDRPNQNKPTLKLR
ncbi:hypothetical protein ABIF26_006445 [Bradyrhizobium elkanii]|uniref:hypothetical protein n=1 Tax=Bradyrhizobium elkanii TaxID=29448 RepID=UPI003515D885